MKAMVLAAGLGTRLRPLTDSRPKALVEVGGRTLLEITLERLRRFGIQHVIIDMHHLAGQIEEFLRKHNNFGMHIELSFEETLLDTGGGLKRAAWFFDSEPFVLHNVDVISTINLKDMRTFHDGHHALATLAIKNRNTSRPLVFDRERQFCGRPAEIVRKGEAMFQSAFCGVHIISPRMIPMMRESGVFSIIASYIDLASRGESILGYPVESAYWRDLGRLEDMKAAAAEIGVWTSI